MSSILHHELTINESESLINHHYQAFYVTINPHQLAIGNHHSLASRGIPSGAEAPKNKERYGSRGWRQLVRSHEVDDRSCSVYTEVAGAAVEGMEWLGRSPLGKLMGWRFFYHGLING